MKQAKETISKRIFNSMFKTGTLTAFTLVGAGGAFPIADSAQTAFSPSRTGAHSFVRERTRSDRPQKSSASCVRDGMYEKGSLHRKRSCENGRKMISATGLLHNMLTIIVKTNILKT